MSADGGEVRSLASYLRVRRARHLEAQERRWNVGFAVPMFLFLVTFFVFPFVFIFLFAFGFYDSSFKFTGEFGLHRFANVFTPATGQLLLKTATVAGAVTGLSLVLGYPVAYFVAQQPRQTREFLIMLLIIPFWTSFLLRTFALMTLFSEGGLVNQFIETIGLSRDPVFTTRNLQSVVWAETYTFMPFMILPMYATLERLSKSAIEASYVLGAGRIQTFVRVILPLSAPGIVAGSLLVFIISMGELVIPSLVGGTDWGYLLGNAIYARYAEIPGEMAALGLVFMAIVLGIALAYVRIAGREGLRL